MLRANCQTQTALTSHDPSLSLFFRFRTIVAIKRYGMKCNTLLYVSCVATSPYNTPSWNFYKLHLQSFPQKQVNVRKYRIIMFSILRHIWPRPMPRWPSVANQDGSILTYFDDPWKIEDLTRSGGFCGRLLQKMGCIILVKKNFWC